MKNFGFVWLVLMVSYLSISTCSASSQTSRDNIYSNFLGEWTGTAVRLKDKNLMTLTMSISLTKNRDKMRIETVFGKGNFVNDDPYIEWVTLDVPRSEMVIENLQGPRRRYSVVGLEQFAAKRYGAFRTMRTKKEMAPL